MVIPQGLGWIDTRRRQRRPSRGERGYRQEREDDDAEHERIGSAYAEQHSFRRTAQGRGHNQADPDTSSDGS